MLKNFFINKLVINWINILIPLLACTMSFIVIAFYNYSTILSWSIIFPLMLLNLAISSCVIYIHLKNDNFDYKKNLKLIFEIIIQAVLMIVSFSLMMFDFYIILLLASNIIYIIYVSCIFDERMNMEYSHNEAI